MFTFFRKCLIIVVSIEYFLDHSSNNQRKNKSVHMLRKNDGVSAIIQKINQQLTFSSMLMNL